MNTHIATLKKQLRREGKQIRSDLGDAARIQASQQICSHIEAWDAFRDAATILTYMPMQGEVDLTFLLARHPHKVWTIPKIHPGGRMVFHRYDPDKLILHKFGMLEPAPDCPVISPEEIDLALVPGLAFDRQGWRLGYGGGFYDRFLSLYSGSFAGITYQALLWDEVPHAAYDIQMPVVITETGSLQTTAA
jgi:5-formyltetrahydrofolate cyclo-ligase